MKAYERNYKEGDLFMQVLRHNNIIFRLHYCRDWYSDDILPTTIEILFSFLFQKYLL